MDTIKIGKFIKELRKEQNLTQKELANKLGITDRAVSRWERGVGCPDISLLSDLSKILNISISELLNGERIESLTIDKADTIIATTASDYLKKYKRKLITILIALTPVFILVFILSYLSINQIFKFENKPNFSLLYTRYQTSKMLEYLCDYNYDGLKEYLPTQFYYNDEELHIGEYFTTLRHYQEKGITLKDYKYVYGQFSEDYNSAGRGWAVAYEITMKRGEQQEKFYLEVLMNYNQIIKIYFNRKIGELETINLFNDDIYKELIA